MTNPTNKVLRHCGLCNTEYYCGKQADGSWHDSKAYCSNKCGREAQTRKMQQHSRELGKDTVRRRQRAVDLREAGYTFSRIARVLGVCIARANQIYLKGVEAEWNNRENAIKHECETCAQIADQVEKEQCGADGLNTAKDIAGRIRARNESLRPIKPILNSPR